MSDCIIKAGESVDPTDPRLSDTACMVESGVIIRPPPDLSIDDRQAPPPAQSVAPIPELPKPIVKMVLAPAPKAAPKVIQKPQVEEKVQTEKPAVNRSPASVAHTVAPEPAAVVVPVEDSGILNPTTAMIAAGAVVAVAGTAAAGSVVGGFSAIQAKIAAAFGVSKGTVATAAVVTAGTIVAVKALENKMSNLEKDLVKTKKEVGETASSIDRIDALLDKLGS